MGDVVGSFVDENEASRTLAPAAVGSQVLLMAGVSLVTIVVFNVLRPKNKEPGSSTRLASTPSPSCASCACCAGSSPPSPSSRAAPAPRQHRLQPQERQAGARDVLSMLTLRDVSGSVLFVHVAATYVFTFLVLFFVWVNWRRMVQLRRAWFRSPEYMESFYARTLMVLKVPRKYHSDEASAASSSPYRSRTPRRACNVGRRVGRLPELIEFHNNAVRELECASCATCAAEDWRAPPDAHQGRLPGIGGKKNKVKRCEAAIEAYRDEIDTRKAENYGFASMAAVPFAHVVARMLHGRSRAAPGRDARAQPAGHREPSPLPLRNPSCIWQNLNKSDAKIASKKMLGWVYLLVVCFCNTLPLLVVSFLANLASLTAYVGFLSAWSDRSHGTFAVISGGAKTRSRLDRSVVARYFAFLVVSQLLIFTLIGVIINSVKEIVAQIGKGASFQTIISNMDRLPDTINRTYIDQANYWLTFFPATLYMTRRDLSPEEQARRASHSAGLITAEILRSLRHPGCP
ncbi:hypothetical protein DFH11DRAFT_1877093 [Phellopilus nigrolimitatus]|nr:hypothetical protein DFH11DRAFT_1877093 [Phellopilus nigrolimitatus]